MFQKAVFVAVAVIAVACSHCGQTLACPGPVTSFSGRKTIGVYEGNNAALLRDHLPSPDNDDKVWYLPTHIGNVVEEYRSIEDFLEGNVLTTYRLPGSAGSGGMAWWGQGHVVYNNSLYYQRFPDCLSYSYDCDNEKPLLVKYDFKLQAFTALQSLSTAHLTHWVAGPSYVYLAVDGGSIWAITVSKERVVHLTKLNAHDLSVEETINTEYTWPNSNMPPFIACGKLYSTVPNGWFMARTDLILDLSTKEKDTTTQALYCLPGRIGIRYFSFNSREKKVSTVEGSNLVSYDVTIGGPFVTDQAMLNCMT